MKLHVKSSLGSVAVLAALVATAVGVMAGPNLSRAGAALGVGRLGEAARPAAATCTKMKASDIAWVTLTDDGDIDEQVDSYPSGTTVITPVFQYDCVPKKVTLVTVFTFNGESVFTDKEALKATNAKGFYGYPLGTTDDTPMDEGEWGVKFYNNKTLLTSGTVIVGDDENGVSQTVTVEGTVTDKKSRKAIRGAIILVLQPGVTVQRFIDRGQKDADVFTAAKSDSKGRFALGSPLARNTEYSIIVIAKGYKATGADGFEIADDDPDPMELTITMTK